MGAPDANIVLVKPGVKPIIIVPRPGGTLKAVTVHQVTTGTDWGSVADWVSGLGSLAAVSVALLTIRLDRRAREKAERQSRQAAFQLATVRVVSVAQNAMTFWRAIVGRVYLQPRAGPRLKMIKPYLGQNAILAEELAPNEVSVFGELREVPLLLKVRLELEMRLAIHAVMRDYAEKFEDLERMAAANGISTSPNGPFHINGTPAFERLADSLVKLSKKISDMAADHLITSTALVDELQEASRRHFGDDGLRFDTEVMRSAADFPTGPEQAAVAT